MWRERGTVSGTMVDEGGGVVLLLVRSSAIRIWIEESLELKSKGRLQRWWEAEVQTIAFKLKYVPGRVDRRGASRHSTTCT